MVEFLVRFGSIASNLMERISGTEIRSASCGEKTEEIGVESLQFGEEIQRLMAAPPETGSSFTALLELPVNQAMVLLHSPETNKTPANDRIDHRRLNCTLTFPSNTTLLERASRFSVFAADKSLETISIPSNSCPNSQKVKQEPVDSDSNTNSSHPIVPNHNKKSTKRKEPEKNKGKGSWKKSKSVATETSDDGDKLPYVHVRARRGQATDSHSLAERVLTY